MQLSETTEVTATMSLHDNAQSLKTSHLRMI